MRHSFTRLSVLCTAYTAVSGLSLANGNAVRIRLSKIFDHSQKVS